MLVAVAPYDDINKYIFILAYRDCNNAKEALASYMGALYDVLILGKLVSDRVQIVYRDLFTYLNEKGISFDQSKYMSVKGASFKKQMYHTL